MREPRGAPKVDPLQPNVALAQAWEAQGGTIEMMSPAPAGTVDIFTKQNLFAKSVHAAFFGHHPLVLSPDVIWLTIAQGLANHVDQNAEALRKEFVPFDGKEEIVISRPNFVKGSPNNDWPSVFPQFAEKIAERSVPGVVELVTCDFSTTGPTERIVSQITLMDAVQHYFTYTMCCGCGLPSVTLTGIPEDWTALRAKAAALKRYGLDWWLEGLLPALDEFAKAAAGDPDLAFWRSLCMISTGASFPMYEPLTGWVQVFFPYLIDPKMSYTSRFTETNDGVSQKALRRNPHIGAFVESWRSGVNVTNFPSSVGSSRSTPEPTGVKEGVKLELFPPALSSAPFTYIDQAVVPSKEYKMAFMGGVTTLLQHKDTGALEPKVGWAVMELAVAQGEAP